MQRTEPPTLLAEEMASNQSNLKPPDQSVFTWYITKLRDMHNQEMTSGRRHGNDIYPFSFDQHCHVLLDLLKHAHEDEPAASAHQKRRDFTHYVLMSTSQKMLKRFEAKVRENAEKFPDVHREAV